MRNIITIPINDLDTLIIASDNSGAIGMKNDDHVHVPYETVAYYSFRVAAMECIAAGGEPISVVLHNFCGNEPWEELVKGIQAGLDELNLHHVLITGSTESNFSLMQSAVGLVVIGKKLGAETKRVDYWKYLKFAIVGLPLIGNEVVQQAHQVAPLSLFHKLCKEKKMIIWPVGSKGILYELNQIFPKLKWSKDMIVSDVDVCKSSGPSTCFIVAYHHELEEKLLKLAGEYLHPLQLYHL
ncbi:AIR synthase related protein [Neobacillus jeddahensis]|uniref:AIR synthase related protein n=1 Tax=Neobacillus jeddahensis TaxID=1461580 RepID=UPI00058DCA6F|nr:AIR synthase related protein [Neobacillus jeddahensis]